MSETIRDAISEATNLLAEITDIPKKESMILLAHILDKDMSYLFINEDRKLNCYEDFIKLARRRADGEPIEYITKKVSFYSKEFFIDYGALIPRPETELLVDNLLKEIKDNNPSTIAEIGVGSGVVSIMLALKLPSVKIVATDISKDALKIAEKNIKKFGLKERITLYHSPYLDKVKEKVDIIVSNPPYVNKDFKVAKPLEFEPKEAIFADGKKGEEILKNIIKLSRERKVKLLACEMGYDQKNILENFLKEQGFNEYYFYKDLSGLDRGFVVKNSLI